MKDLDELISEKREIIKELHKEPVGNPAYTQLAKDLNSKKQEILKHPDYPKKK